MKKDNLNTTKKICKCCGNERDIDKDFYESNGSTCKKCLIEIANKNNWNKSNRERHNAIVRKYYDTVHGKYKSLVDYHNRSKKKYPKYAAQFKAYDDLTEKELGELIAESGLKCKRCRKDVSDGCYHIDHSTSIKNGGVLAKWNLQILCPRCNKSKGSENVLYVQICIDTGDCDGYSN